MNHFVAKRMSECRAHVQRIKSELRTAAASIRAELRVVQRRYRAAARSEKPTHGSLDPFLMTWSLGMMLAGAVYVLIFAPLAWQSAQGTVGERLASVLLLEFPPGMSASLVSQVFPPLSSLETRPFLYALATLYGVVGVVAAIVVAAGGLVRLVLVANGIFYGFFLTRYVATAALGVLPYAALEGRLLYFKLAYLMLSYYAATSLVTLLSKDDLAREKFDFALTSAQALFAGWLLAKGFGTTAAVYSGVIYVACTFITLTASEAVLRPLLRLGKAAFGTRVLAEMDSDRYLPPRVLLVAFRDAWRGAGDEVVAIVGIQLAFPALVAAVYWLALQGRW